MNQAKLGGGTGPLWARPHESREQRMALWQAGIIALLVEMLLPLGVFGIDWSFMRFQEPPPPVKVMNVEIHDPPPEPPPPEAPPKKVQRKPPPVAIELPKPVAGEKPSKIQLPMPEPEPPPEPRPQPRPEPEPEPKEEPPEEVVEEPAPLPSVFQDVKPVRKVRIRYPREAEDQHIQGRVKVRLSVSPEGKVIEAEILLSEPPGVFDEAVLEGVRQYVFKKDGNQYKADQEVIFKIDD